MKINVLRERQAESLTLDLPPSLPPLTLCLILPSLSPSFLLPLPPSLLPSSAPFNPRTWPFLTEAQTTNFTFPRGFPCFLPSATHNKSKSTSQYSQNPRTSVIHLRSPVNAFSGGAPESFRLENFSSGEGAFGSRRGGEGGREEQGGGQRELDFFSPLLSSLWR